MTDQKNPPPPAAARNRLPLLILGAVAVLGILGWGLHYLTVGRFHVGTDDAYVDGNLVRLTPQVAGTVTAINTDETQFVHRGQVLVQLDPRDTQVALAQAKANLAQTVRDVAQLFSEAQRNAALVQSQQVQLAQTRQDVEREIGRAHV